MPVVLIGSRLVSAGPEVGGRGKMTDTIYFADFLAAAWFAQFTAPPMTGRDRHIDVPRH